MNRSLFSRLVVYLVAVIGVPVLFAAALSVVWIPYYKLEQSGREVRAVVVRTRPDNHGDLDLAYMVGRRVYSVTTSPGRGNPNLRELYPGDSVYLTYLPARPELARGGRRPRGTLRELAGAMGVFAAIAAVVAPFFFLLGGTKSRREGERPGFLPPVSARDPD